MRGRPSVFTPGRYAAICDQVAKGGTVKAACADVGISRRALYAWAEGNPRIARALKDAQREGKRNGVQTRR